MLKKLLSIFLICAFLNLSYFSCTKRSEVDIPIEYIGQEAKEKIIEVILPDGKVIQFKKNGAYYKVLPERIVGTSALGVKENIDLSQITEIRITKPETVSTENFDPQKITEVITLQNTYVKIDEEGCRLLDDQKTYQGKTITGNEFKFRFSFFVAGIFVRMVFKCKLTESFFYLIVCCIAGNT